MICQKLLSNHSKNWVYFKFYLNLLIVLCAREISSIDYHNNKTLYLNVFGHKLSKGTSQDFGNAYEEEASHFNFDNIISLIIHWFSIWFSGIYCNTRDHFPIFLDWCKSGQFLLEDRQIWLTLHVIYCRFNLIGWKSPKHPLVFQYFSLRIQFLL